MLLSLFLFHMFIIIPFGAADGIAAVEIALPTPVHSWTVETITVTIWFDHVVYQYPLVTDVSTKTYTTTSLSVLGKYECASSNPPSKMMISNPGVDGLMIDEIKITTTSGTWYGIQGRCIDDLFMVTQSWVVDSDGYEDWYTAEPLCDSGNSNIWICIDNQDTDCGPAKQVLYFDTSRPSQYINDADWSEGGTVSASVGTCPTPQPTNNPTANPTNKPTLAPTLPPMNAPTTNPYVSPSFSPTLPPAAPSSAPSSSPTSAPTLPPTHAPSSPPTLAPTINPTFAPSSTSSTPSSHPTRAPTNNPTSAPTSAPTLPPTHAPSSPPTLAPTINPTFAPSSTSSTPSSHPTRAPTNNPTSAPTLTPTANTESPTSAPSNAPSSAPTAAPTLTTNVPTTVPTLFPTVTPSVQPTLHPTTGPSQYPTIIPTFTEMEMPTMHPFGERRVDVSTIAPTELNFTVQQNNDPSVSISTVLLIVAGSLCFICVVSITCCYIKKTDKKELIATKVQPANDGVILIEDRTDKYDVYDQTIGGEIKGTIMLVDVNAMETVNANQTDANQFKESRTVEGIEPQVATETNRDSVFHGQMILKGSAMMTLGQKADVNEIVESDSDHDYE
eukprot:481083_1